MKWMALALLSLCFSLARAAKFEVRVADKTTVRTGDPVRLGTLISGQIEDKELSDKIYDLVVFEPLTSEGEHVYRSEELALTLRRKLSFQDLQRLSMKIPEQFAIRAKRNYIYPADLIREITQAAQRVCGDCTVQFDDLKVPEIKAKDEILQTRLETQPLKAAGSFLLPLITETSNGKNVFWVTGRISFYKLAPVARRLLQSNEALSQNDFEFRKVDVSFARDGVPTGDELIGKTLSRTISIGQPIFAGDLKKEVAARRGQMVKILVGGEAFEIATSGVAEEGGSIGEVIRVKSDDTKKMLSGVLVDKATVRIQ